MRKGMFGYRIKAMHNRCVRGCLGIKSKLCVRDVQVMRKQIRQTMFGYKIKGMHKECISYA